MSTGRGGAKTRRPSAIPVDWANGDTWDQRLARFLVRPLVHTPVTPNHVTTLRLLVGLGACAVFAEGDPAWANWGALLFVLSNFIDHADGELARLSGKASRFGHNYDITCDALVHTLVFTAIGFGLRESALGEWAVALGLVAGVSVGILFWIFSHRHRLYGRAGVQPRWGGFDLEDVLYLVAPIVWLDGQLPLLFVAAGASPLAALWMMWHHRRVLFAAASQEREP